MNASRRDCSSVSWIEAKGVYLQIIQHLIERRDLSEQQTQEALKVVPIHSLHQACNYFTHQAKSLAV